MQAAEDVVRSDKSDVQKYKELMKIIDDYQKHLSDTIENEVNGIYDFFIPPAYAILKAVADNMYASLDEDAKAAADAYKKRIVTQSVVIEIP